MSRRYPAIRLPPEEDDPSLFDSLALNFFMPHSHGVVAPRVLRSLETFLRAIPPGTMKQYLDVEGEWRRLDEEGWHRMREEGFTLPGLEASKVILSSEYAAGRYHAFHYTGRWLENPEYQHVRTRTSAVSFTLPTGYLEQQGPGPVRALALALAAELPFSFGYGTLALVMDCLMPQATRSVLQAWPGLDVCELDAASHSIGTGARGAYWLTFLGPPLLRQVGGLETLRQRLPFPDVSFHSLDEERVLLTLGEWPIIEEAGPSLRALACLLEPFFPQEKIPALSSHQEDIDRWMRRFCG